MRRRAASYAGQQRLVVDYYRIRRRLAFPLPLRSAVLPSVPVPTISDYPWTVWLLWELEERVNSLGWAAEWFGNPEYVRLAARDLEALSEWPKFRQYEQPDLGAGHAGRLLWSALTKWRWPDAELRKKLRAACVRHVEEVAPASDSHYRGIRTRQDLLSQPDVPRWLHNIPLIGTVGAALAAAAAGHPARAALNQRIQAIMGAILDFRNTGYTEGVAYDGYILDFVADWLEALPLNERKEILEHPHLKHFLEESYMLSAPGAMEQVAELGDVEPREMPFHFSAQAKLASLQADPLRAWYLERWRSEWIRADALGALRASASLPRRVAPEAGALNAHYALVLRTGWESEDLAAAVSCSNSPMGHLQLDNGTVVIGTRGRWILSDPGYQQYMQDIEREFTIGPAAHNYPLINGIAQDRKMPRLMRLGKTGDVLSAAVELAGCYPPAAKVRSVVRTVWVSKRNLVVVADHVEGESVETLSYHWHAHPEAALWPQDGAVLLHTPEAELWLASPQVPLSDDAIRRLPGSRGQLTVVAGVAPAPPVVWWVFALGGAPPRVEVSDRGRQIAVLGRQFEIQ
ncbi:MAG TPA: heparinase II/III family protein [Bryobacteraceae bacterium]|nr:heparinase II/III family protein [Bryobacteraceae bacterium]